MEGNIIYMGYRVLIFNDFLFVIIEPNIAHHRANAYDLNGLELFIITKFIADMIYTYQSIEDIMWYCFFTLWKVVITFMSYFLTL